MPAKAVHSDNLLEEIRDLRRNGDFGRALSVLEDAKEGSKPESFGMERAILLHRLKRDDEALAELDRLGQRGAKSDARLLRARVLIALGRLDDAAQIVRDKDLGKPPQTTALRTKIARDYFYRGSFKDAASLAKLARPNGRKAAKWEVPAHLLAGDRDGLLAALQTHGEEASSGLIKAVAFSLRQLEGRDMETGSHAHLDNLKQTALNAIHLLSDPMHARALASSLAGVTDHDEHVAILGRAGELERLKSPGSIWDIEYGRTAPSPKMAKQLTRIAEWLGIAGHNKRDWVEQAYGALLFRRRLQGLVENSVPHLEELEASLTEPDWTEVRKCHDRGQPVLLIALHSSFRPALQIALRNLDLGVKAIAESWRFASHPVFGNLFFDEPKHTRMEETAKLFTEAEISRNMIRHLNNGGILSILSDGQIGARPRDLKKQGIRASLPAPLWTLAHRKGAAVFFLECVWRQNQLTFGLRQCAIPEDPGSEEAEDMWYDLLLSACKSNYLADYRNVVPSKWLL